MSLNGLTAIKYIAYNKCITPILINNAKLDCFAAVATKYIKISLVTDRAR